MTEEHYMKNIISMYYNLFNQLPVSGYGHYVQAFLLLQAKL